MQRNSWRLTCLVAVFATAIFFNHASDSWSAEQKAQLYFFTNESCPPCKMVEPEVEKIFSLGYSVMKVDTHRHPDWTARFGVTRTPTVVLTVGNQEVTRKSGHVNAAELQSWFRAVEQAQESQSAQQAQARAIAARQQPSPSTNSPAAPNASSLSNRKASNSGDPTQGFYEAENQSEQLALQSSVRLKIDDPLGTSYATGTVIHTRDNESLVLTCGHVFRDSNGKGTITAEHGFAAKDVQVANGELLFYDADERDIGLVAIRTKRPIQPVEVAAVDHLVNKGNSIFTIGCDHGERPSIRRSQVKNQAKYDGINKYEIFGRPVSGRSGGGMFTADGKLVGVCNAAVVDVDEGVYVALDTIHWQFERTHLAHLFNGRTPVDYPLQREGDTAPRELLADVVARPFKNVNVPNRNGDLPRRDFSSIPVRDPLVSTEQNSLAKANDLVRASAIPSDGNGISARPVSNNGSFAGTNKELIVVLRDRVSEEVSDSWTVENPSQQLIEDLHSARSSTYPGESSNNRMAQLRRDMPNLQPASSRIYNSDRVRAQSPR